MSVAIGQIERDDITRLISSTDYAKLDSKGKAAFDRCLLFTTQMWAGFHNGKFTCAWGIIPPSLLSLQAYLWLYVTEDLKGHEFLFVRHSQVAIEQILNDYPTIVGHTHVSLTKAIRWLRWLGAEYGEPQGEYVPFIIRKK